MYMFENMTSFTTGDGQSVILPNEEISIFLQAAGHYQLQAKREELTRELGGTGATFLPVKRDGELSNWFIHRDDFTLPKRTQLDGPTCERLARFLDQHYQTLTRGKADFVLECDTPAKRVKELVDLLVGGVHHGVTLSPVFAWHSTLRDQQVRLVSPLGGLDLAGGDYFDLLEECEKSSWTPRGTNDQERNGNSIYRRFDYGFDGAQITLSDVTGMVRVLSPKYKHTEGIDFKVLSGPVAIRRRFLDLSGQLITKGHGGYILNITR